MQKRFILSLCFIMYTASGSAVYSDSQESSPNQNSQTDYSNVINKLVDESRNDVTRLDQQIKDHANLKRTQMREDYAKECYQKGLTLTEQGRFSEARAYFDKAIHVTQRTEMTQNIKEGEDRLRIQEEALRKAKKELDAEEVEKQKILEQRQVQLDEQYRRKQQESRIVQQQRQKEEVLKVQERIRKEAMQEKELQEEQERKEAKEEAQRIEKLRQEEAKKQAEDIRQERLAALAQAKEEAQKKEDLRKEEAEKNRQAQEQKRLMAQAAREEAIKRAEDLRQERLAAAAKTKEEALKKEELHKEEAQKKEDLRKEKETKELLIKQTETDYRTALDLYRDKIYKDAKDKFEVVNAAFPHYKATDSYLRKIDEITSFQEKNVKQEQGKSEQLLRKQEEIKQKHLEQQQRQALDLQRKEEKRKSLEQQRKQLQEAKLSQDEAKKRQLMEKQEVLERQKKEKEADQKIENDISQEKELKVKHQEILEQDKQVKEQKKKLLEESYLTAVEFYKENKFREAKDKFEVVNAQSPRYKATSNYLKRIDGLIAKQEWRDHKEQKRTVEQRKKQAEESQRTQDKHRKWVENQKSKNLINKSSFVPIPGETSKPVILKEEPKLVVPVQSPQQDTNEAELLTDLAEKSSRLYKEISSLADDRHTAAAMNKLAKVDGVLNNLKEEKERSIRQIREEEERRHQQELKDKKQLRSKEASATYDQAINLVSSRNFDEAKRKFIEVEALYPNYKSTHSYLKNIDEDQRRMQEEALAEKSRDEQRILREQQIKKKEEERLLRQQRLAKLQERVVEMAQKAAATNDTILKLTMAKNYSEAKIKLDELEGVMSNLKKVKDLIATEKDESELLKLQAREMELSKKEIDHVLHEKRLESIQNKNNSVYKKYQEQDVKEAKAFKKRENQRQKDVVFRQGVELFKAKKYQEAKIIFSELVSKGDVRAKSYLNKIDQTVGDRVADIKTKVDHDRSEYLAERLTQQRVKRILDTNEQERQKKLSKDLEKQKLYIEHQQQDERRRTEALRTQNKQRQRLENERERLENQIKSQDKEYHFRKVQPVSTEVKASEILKEDKDTLIKDSESTVKNVKFLGRETPDDVSRLEIQKRSDLTNSVKEHQQKLEKERLTIRRQLESGVEKMYEEAVKLYKTGHYQAAATRFSDIQDLIPNYRNSNQYLKKTEGRSNKVSIPLDSLPKTTIPSKEDQISKTLDLFDTNPK